MPSPKPATPSRPNEAQAKAQPPSHPQLIDPAWLLRAGLALILLALLCGYATFCTLFARGQWQLVLHPVHSTQQPASIAGRPFQTLHFGPDSTGRPQLVGWLLPAGPEAPFRHLTVLVLHSGDTDLPDLAPLLTALHQTGVSVFAFDYRGFGQSGTGHPTQVRMQQDAEAAWQYLTAERSLPPSRVIPYGIGVGGSLALTLTSHHPQTSVVVLDHPRYDVLNEVRHDPRARLLPVSWLFHERFPLEPALSTLRQPKLIVTRATTEDPRSLHAADPKRTLALPERNDTRDLEHALTQFLSTYAPPTPMAPLPLPLP